MKNIKTNSKYIKKNDIFICTHDYQNKHKYIKDAIKKKPSVIIIDEQIKDKSKIPLIKVNNTNDTLFQIANNYYDYPLEKLKVIGITGTDGKTTTATITKQLLSNFEKCAYLGTNGLEYENVKIPTKNTTPSEDLILKYANLIVKNNCKYLIMEVSSEALLHNRCKNILFDEVALTNITKDHLNIHKTFQNYLNSKLKLFKQTKKNATKIINIDDKHYKDFFRINKKNVLTYGTNKKATYRFTNIKEDIDKTTFTLTVNKKTYNIISPLKGIFNVYNLVCALLIIHSLGYDLDKIIKIIKNIKDVSGRMNYFKTKNKSLIILDYAHTKEATKQILEFANKIKRKRIITVVGCAGRRDKSKRKEIGKIVTDLSDIAIFTMDDPRDEDISNIFKDMEEDVTNNNVIKIKNRKKAIKKAIKISKEDDLILILGKGTDNYMAIKNKYKRYSDLKVIKKIIR